MVAPPVIIGRFPMDERGMIPTGADMRSAITGRTGRSDNQASGFDLFRDKPLQLFLTEFPF